MKLKLALAAATVLSASAAFATPVSLTYNGTASGSESVTVTSFPGGTAAIAGSDNVTSASTFKMTDSADGGLGDFFAWCVDLTAFLGGQGEANEYTITDTPFASTFDFGADTIDRIANLFNANYSEDITTDSEKSAGFQLAIWESVYDDDFSLTTGTFAATSNAGVTGYATDYLAAASGFDGDVIWDVLFLESTPGEGVRRQNLVTVAAVPLPASALLLLAGLGAFGMARRRQSA